MDHFSMIANCRKWITFRISNSDLLITAIIRTSACFLSICYRNPLMAALGCVSLPARSRLPLARSSADEARGL